MVSAPRKRNAFTSTCILMLLLFSVNRYGTALVMKVLSLTSCVTERNMRILFAFLYSRPELLLKFPNIVLRSYIMYSFEKLNNVLF